MGAKAEQIIQRLREISTGSNTLTNASTYRATVLSIDKAKSLCVVRVLQNEALVLEDVSLRAVDDEQVNGFILYPVVGSAVLVSKIEGQNNYYLEMVSEVEKVRIESKSGESIKAILEDLLDAITQLTVTTGVGPSGTPINALDFTNIKTRINQLFE